MWYCLCILLVWIIFAGNLPFQKTTAVSITDQAAVIFGGTDDPTALGCLYSIGGISATSNGAITAAVSDLLQPHGVDPARVYIQFFDMPRANVGWNRSTFAG
jgi:phenylpyruvate tautomerase